MATGERFVFCLLVLSLALGVAQGDDDYDCEDCFSTPNTCPSEQSVTSSTADRDAGERCTSSDYSRCCVGNQPSCELSSGSCCNKYETACKYGYSRYAMAPPGSSQRCIDSGSWNQAATCPPNFNRESQGSYNFCLDPNCKTVRGEDCTACLTCKPGHLQVDDNSCQPQPIIAVTITQPQRNRAVGQCQSGTTDQVTFSADPMSNTATLSLSIQASTTASRSGVGGPATISSTTCTRNGQALNSNSWNAVTFNVGTTSLRCCATDSNSLSQCCTTMVTVRDTEPPYLLCAPALFTPAANTNYAIYDWTTSMTLTTNPITQHTCSSVIFSTPTVSGGQFSFTVTILGAGTAPIALSWRWSKPISMTNIWNAVNQLGNSYGYSYTSSIITNDKTTSFGFQASTVDNSVPNHYNFYINGMLCGAPNISRTSGSTFASVTGSDNVAVQSLSCINGPTNNRFSVGSPTVIRCTGIDAAQNSATCTYSVTVMDNVPPVVTCPAPATIPTSTNGQTAVYTWNNTATDNVGVYNVSCQPPSGSTFSLDNTATVNCKAVDTSGNQGTCSFTVTVRDQQPPTLTCPTTNQVYPTGGAGSTASVVLSGISATDNSGTQPSITCNPGGYSSVTTFPLGTTSVKCSAVDVSGNRAPNCTFNVVVVDRTPPLITSCQSVTLSTLPNVAYATMSGSFAFAATDNVGVMSTNCTPNNQGGTRQWAKGATPVSCTAYDANNNNATCSLTVTVTDNQQPNVVCPDSPITRTTSSPNGYDVNFTMPTATDNVGLNYTTLTATFNGVDKSLPPTTTNYTFSAFGSVSFTFRAYDTSGNYNFCFWLVNLLVTGQAADNTPPQIHNCPTPFLLPRITSVAYANYNSSFYTYNVTTLPGRPFGTVVFAALNATDANLVVASYAEWSPSALTAAQYGLPVGQFLVAYGAIDQAGNTAYCVFKVSVTDPEAPTFANCPGSMQYLSGAASAVPATAWPAAGIVAQDNVQVVSAAGTCVSQPSGWCPPGGSAPTTLFPVGVYSFTYTATDTSGNQAAPCRFNVTVLDTSPPDISCFSTPTSLTLTTDPGKTTASIVGKCPVFNVSDNVGVTDIVYASTPAGYNCSSALPISNPNGVTITISALDAAGQSRFCVVTATVFDREVPRLYGCQADQLISVGCDAGQPTAQIWLPAIDATDNSGATTLSTTSLPAGLGNGSSFAPGYSTVTITARDFTNNSASCVFRIVVTDTEPPVIDGMPASTMNGLATYSLTTDPGQATGTLTLPDLTATDNVGIFGAGFVASQYVPLGSYSFPRGQTVLNYAATDTSRSTTYVTILINVTDNEAPVFVTCPSPSEFVANTTAGTSTVRVYWDPVTALDNVDGALIRVVPVSYPAGYTSDSLFPVGTTTVVYTATDNSGNSRTCTVTVRVFDVEPPKLICPSKFTVVSDIDFNASVDWRDPIITDNNRIAYVNATELPGNFSTGEYNVRYDAWDESGNTAHCNFSFVVQQAQQSVQASTGASSSSAILGGAAGGGGGLLLLLLLLLVVLFIMRRNHKKKLSAASAGYAELMCMSDEFILERARVIQESLIEQRQAEPPIAVQTTIHPDAKFAVPPAQLDQLQEFLYSRMRKEINRAHLRFGAELGSGEFGSVFEGFYEPPQQSSKVAIKMLKNSNAAEDCARFLKEAAIMAQFSHPNIVSLVGVCTRPTSEPTLIVLEYMHLGALHGYLQSSLVKDRLETLTMLRMALDVVAGMQYLAEAGFIHRDLAARNVLLDKTMTCRIGDFGLSVELAAPVEGADAVYSGAEGARLPVRWCSIEAICFQQFSTASDVWSYGVLLWEIWSYAELPYKGWTNKKVVEEVSSGYRLPNPSNCPTEIYRVMLDCWNKNVKRRITFPKISSVLVEIWHDLTKSDSNGGSSPALYDNTNSADPDEEGDVYDTGFSEDDQANGAFDKPTMVGSHYSVAKARGQGQTNLYDNPGVNGPRTPAAATSQPRTINLYDNPGLPSATGSKRNSVELREVSLTDANATAEEDEHVAISYDVPTPVSTIEQSRPLERRCSTRISTKGGGHRVLTEADTGIRVMVLNYGPGKLRYVGTHHVSGDVLCGVELDSAEGYSDGNFGGQEYFQCKPFHGVLVDPRGVLALEKSVVLNPIYDDTIKMAAAATSPRDSTLAPGGYLEVGMEDESCADDMPGVVQSSNL